MGLFDGVMSAVSPFLGPASALIGGMMTQQGQEQTNAANSAQSQAQMDFQERMSNTAYQRATKDMMAAGLNPMLAYTQGGASTPGGAMATMQNAKGAGVASAQQGAQTAASTGLLRAQTDNQSAQGDLYRAQADELRSRIPTTGALGLKYKQDTETGAATAAQIKALEDRIRYLMPAERGELLDRAFSHRASGYRSSTEGNFREDYMRHGGVRAEVASHFARARALGASAALDEYGASGARRESDINDSSYGAGRPLLHDIARFFSGAAAARRGFGLR